MFNVARPATHPKCTQATGYNTKKIVQELEHMFHGKCYLCEQSNLADPEIEHFHPHENDVTLKYDWFNLYYACSRCNNIKGSKHINLLDCCDPETDVFQLIRIVLPTIPCDDVSIQSQDPYNHKANNTANLLSKCFNDQTTGLRGITRSALMENLQEEYYYLLTQVGIAISRRSAPQEISKALSRIQVMLLDSYPFSAIWKWYVLGHKALLKHAPNLTESFSPSNPKSENGVRPIKTKQ